MINMSMLLLLAATESKTQMTSDEIRFFEKLYADYADSIYRRMEAALHGNIDAEDLTQQCLLKLAENVHTLMELKEFQLAKYITVTIENTLCNYWRRGSFISIESIETRTEELTEKRVQYQPEVMVDLQDEVQRFTAAYEQLTDKEKVLMYYRYIEDLSGKEIAEKLGIKTSAVRQAIYRAKQHIYEIMQKGVDQNER